VPILWQRDDERHLLIVTVTEPYTADEALQVLERQATEGIWDYPALYDLRAVKTVFWADPAAIKELVEGVGGGRPLSPTALVIGGNPDQFRIALSHPGHTFGSADFEVLVTQTQVDDWIRRHTRRREPRI
jgi:hypothetical protein